MERAKILFWLCHGAATAPSGVAHLLDRDSRHFVLGRTNSLCLVNSSTARLMLQQPRPPSVVVVVPLAGQSRTTQRWLL